MRDTKSYCMKTNVMCQGYDPESSYPRPNSSTKWNKVVRSIWEEFQQKGILDSGYDDDEKYFSGDGLYYRRMGVASMFEELVPAYISDHVLC